MRTKLTEAQRKCLGWYEANRNIHPSNRPHTNPSGWNMRQRNRLLDMDMLYVGPGGWHVPTDAGRASLAAQ